MQNLKTLLFFAFITLLATQAQAQNLLVNGNFTQGANAWNVWAANGAEASVQPSDAYAKFGLADNFIGTNFLALDEEVGIRQTVATEAERTYLVQFAFSHRPDAGDQELIIEVDDRPVFHQKVPQSDRSGHFRYRHFTFTAQDAETEVNIYVVPVGENKGKGVLLSDIELAEEGTVELKLDYEY